MKTQVSCLIVVLLFSVYSLLNSKLDAVLIFLQASSRALKDPHPWLVPIDLLTLGGLSNYEISSLKKKKKNGKQILKNEDAKIYVVRVHS